MFKQKSVLLPPMHVSICILCYMGVKLGLCLLYKNITLNFPTETCRELYLNINMNEVTESWIKP